MEKEFVPYKLALRMKQLGFNEPCLAFYGDENDFSMDSSRKNNPFRKTECVAPLYQQAFRWFREKYELHSFIDCKWKNLGWEFELVDLSKMETISSIDRYNYKTFEEAELACIEKLIEIVEQKNEN
jgi:hypothetical protein